MSEAAVMHHGVEPAETPLTPESWGKLGMWVFLAGDAMSFGAFAAGIMVSLAEPEIGRTAALHMPYLVGASVCAVLAAYGFFRLRF